MTGREKRRGLALIVTVFAAALITVAGADWFYAGVAVGLIVGVYVGNEAR